MKTFLFLIIGHYVSDFALQSDFMAKFKNPFIENPLGKYAWIHIMTAHCAVQAGAVLLITGRWELAVGEFIVHFATDYLKCAGKIGLGFDQTIHIACKVAWFYIGGIQ